MLIETDSQSIVTFYRAIAEARPPMRADPAALGTLPTRGFQYCEALRSASSFGWYVFAPIDFTLQWDGADVIWTYAGADGWYPLHASAQFPGFAAQFDRMAPKRLRGYAPPFLAVGAEPGLIQVWSGLFVESAENWSMLVRPPANLPRSLGYESYEGIVETDRWFGPLFTNLRLVKTDVPIHIGTEIPLLQVQPLHRSVYTEGRAAACRIVDEPARFTPHVWKRYEDTIVKPNRDPARPIAAYAAAARKRRKGVCPMASAAQDS